MDLTTVVATKNINSNLKRNTEKGYEQYICNLKKTTTEY